MQFNKLVEKMILLGLLVSVIGTVYIFIVTIVLHETTFAGFYSTWQFPMLLAIFIDTAFYKHVNKLYDL